MPEPFLVQPRRPRAAVAGERVRIRAVGALDDTRHVGPRGAESTGFAPGAASTGFVPRAVRAAAVDDGGPTPRDRSPERTEPIERVPARSWTDHALLQPLRAYLEDPAVTDVFVNGSAGLFVDRGRGAEPVAQWRAAEADVRELAIALIALGGRHLDDAAPAVDVRLDGGARVHAVLPPVSAGGTAISIRVPRLDRVDLDALDRAGMFAAGIRSVLDDAVRRRVNLLVTGAAGAGKTTLLAALLGAAAPGERIVTVEDVAELRIDHQHHVRLEARQANLEGVGAIDLARLVREALRMRPDRLVVGECRGAEVRELLSALNTGHDGGAGTLHANSLRDVPARLEALGALAGLDDAALARQAVGAIGLVVHVERREDGARQVVGIARPFIDDGGRLSVEDVPCSAG